MGEPPVELIVNNTDQHLHVEGAVTVSRGVTGAALSDKGLPLRICVGNTEGRTTWSQSDDTRFLQATFDSSGCAFTSTPVYMATLVTDSVVVMPPLLVVGPGKSRFGISIANCVTPTLAQCSPQYATDAGWRVNWVAYGI